MDVTTPSTLKALVGADLARSFTLAPSSEIPMSGRRINPVHTSTSHFGSILSSAPGSGRQARRALASLERQSKPVPDDLRERAEERARVDAEVASWLAGGDPFAGDGGELG